MMGVGRKSGSNAVMRRFRERMCGCGVLDVCVKLSVRRFNLRTLVEVSASYFLIL